MPESVLRERLRRDRFFQGGLLVRAFMVSAPPFAPWLAPHNPVTGDLKGAYLIRPGSRFLLGTDTQGRDVLSRVLYGDPPSLAPPRESRRVPRPSGVPP